MTLVCCRRALCVQINQYVIEKKLGRGAFARVMLVRKDTSSSDNDTVENYVRGGAVVGPCACRGAAMVWRITTSRGKREAAQYLSPSPAPALFRAAAAGDEDIRQAGVDEEA